jgi:hypothetical protein
MLAAFFASFRRSAKATTPSPARPIKAVEGSGIAETTERLLNEAVIVPLGDPPVVRFHATTWL